MTVPKWVTQKLISSGIIPLGNLLDFQRYILLETGYPFTFYDFHKLTSKLNTSEFSLLVSKAKNNYEFIATNGNTYKLDESILVITANKIPLSIGGIIENQEFKYSKSTTSLLIEGSTFNATEIRKQSRKLGLQTDRSIRYQKSIKNTYLMESLYRLVSLLRIANPNLKCKFNTMSKKLDQIIKPILLRYKTIHTILGPSNRLSAGPMDVQTIEHYLNRLKFSFVFDEIKQVWKVRIPGCRTEDITREIDLIEEIGRLHGFNNFLVSLPKFKTIGTEAVSYTHLTLPTILLV